MANRRRGEIAAVVAGEPVTLCLTLGALAELESAFGVGDLVALAERFSSGRLSARDLLCIFAAGLRGGGHPVTDDAVAAMRIDGGLTALAALVADLLDVTFGVAADGAAGAGGDAPSAGTRAGSEDAASPPAVPGAASPSLGTR